MYKDLTVVALAGLMFLGAGACRKAGRGAGETTGYALAGTIQVKGSDTLLMLSQRWAEAFMAKNPGAVVQVTGGGSGVGFKSLVDGSTTIANASRPIKDEEKGEARDKGVEPFEVKVALDGVAFVVHKDNPLNEITLAQVGAIYRGDVKEWEKVGGKGGKILCYGRQSTSGTYEYVKEHVLGKKDYRADIQEMSGTSLICDAVAKDKAGIGYAGVGYAMKRTDLKILGVKKDDGSKAVVPNLATVADNSYPVSRYLFNYTNGKPTGVAKAFIEFALSPEGQKLVEEVEYIPLPATTALEEINKMR